MDYGTAPSVGHTTAADKTARRFNRLSELISCPGADISNACVLLNVP